MSILSTILDEATGRTARIVDGRALAVNPPHPSIAFNATLGTDDTAVNIVPAKAAHMFCITDILLTANQNVSNTTSATVSLYVGDAEDTALGSAITTLLTIPLGRNDARDITGILLEAAEGKWINAETTDDDIFVTILGYYISTEDS